MDYRAAIRNYSNHPIPHQVIYALLRHYRRPNDKIHSLLSQGVLESVKKGLYIAGPALTFVKPEPFLLANHILGPSYVSLDTALSFHGWIPERVFEIASMTTKASRKFDTTMGLFTYTHLPLPYYAFGIQQVQLADEQFTLVSTPEKALFDKVITTAGITLRSKKQATAYLLEDLRIDEEKLKSADIAAMHSWLADASKRDGLALIIKAIEAL